MLVCCCLARSCQLSVTFPICWQKVILTINNKEACLYTFSSVWALSSVRSWGLRCVGRMRMRFHPDVNHAISFLHLFTSLMKGTPCQMIKHRYDPSYPLRRCRQKFKSSSKMLPIYSHIHKTRLGRMAMSVLATVFNMLASRIQRPLLGIFNGFILSLWEHISLSEDVITH